MKRILPIICFLLFPFISYGAFNALKSAPDDTTSMLFLGNSYTMYNNLPFIIKTFCIKTGKTIYQDDHLVENTGLTDWAVSTEVEEKIVSRQWDYIIIQGSGMHTAYPEIYYPDPVFEPLKSLKESILNNCDSTRIIFIMPWAFEDGMTWLEGWTDDFEDMQIKIYNNTLKYCNDLDIMVAPVGWAWYKVLEQKAYPLHYLHIEDYNHPSPTGSYLMGCVIYSTVFLEGTRGIDYYAALDIKEAQYLQGISVDVVFTSPTIWNLPDVQVGILDTEEDIISLFQNYPNPVERLTRIEFETATNGEVELILFNQTGNRCIELINSYMPAGRSSITFDRGSLPCGVYYYFLRVGDVSVTRKMVIIN